MNAFARGNVANATRTLARLRGLIDRARQNHRTVQAAGIYLDTIDGDLATAIEDLERAVALDSMTEGDAA